MTSTAPKIRGYSDLRLIGRGGFAEVYSARQDAFDRPVAIKVITVELDESMQRRFAAECQALGKLARHPNIVDVYDSGLTENGRPYVAMELCEGGSAADAAARARGPISLPFILDLGVKVADALDHAHRAGVIHRDVKPANILLTGAGDPIVVDFGIATLEGIESRTATVATMTPAHAAPERFDMHAGDEKTDVYSLASTLYALLEGRAPFERDGANSVSAIVKRMVTEEAAPLSRPDASPGLRHLFRQALAKDPAQRPTMTQFRDGLEASLGALNAADQTQIGTNLVPSGRPIASVPPPPNAVPAPGMATTARPEGARSPRALWAIGGYVAAVVVVIIVGVLAASQLGGDDPAPTTTGGVTDASTTAAPTTAPTTAPATTAAPPSTETPTTAAPVNPREWDGIRFDLGAIQALTPGPDAHINFDRYALASDAGEPLDASSLTSEPVVLGNTDVPWSNTNTKLRAYSLAPDVQVLELTNLAAAADCALDGGGGAAPEWTPRNLEQLAAIVTEGRAGQVSLTFNAVGQVTLIRVSYGC